jgi:hypothetical protein
VLEKPVVESESDIGALKVYRRIYLSCPLIYDLRFTELIASKGARSSVAVEAVCYKPE